jgi:pyruvate/2-oxoglutarate dehydrogenase complex dihydrolipoamide acyltransferase (E2) component
MSDPAGLKGTVEIVEPTPAERTIARRAAEARATVPDLELGVDVDMGRWVERAGESGPAVGALLVRAAGLKPSERSGATFTLARYGVTRAGGLIPPPHAVAVAAGELREVPGIRDGAVVPTHGIALTLASDHRILYGANAARVLARIRELLEHAEL